MQSLRGNDASRARAPDDVLMRPPCHRRRHTHSSGTIYQQASFSAKFNRLPNYFTGSSLSVIISPRGLFVNHLLFITFKFYERQFVNF